MGKIPDKGSLQIILQSDDIDDNSEHWQRQCKNLYEELYRALPEGYIRPSKGEVYSGERSLDIILFSTIIVSEVAAKLSSSIIFEALNNWSENIRGAYIKVKCPDGNTIKVPNQFLLKLSKYSYENQNLSIYEILNQVIKLT